MLNVRLVGDHLYGKWLSTWVSQVMSLMGLFVPRDVFDEIWAFIESASEDFPIYFYKYQKRIQT